VNRAKHAALEVVAVMWGYGQGWVWMLLVSLLWLVLIGLIVWAVVTLSLRARQPDRETERRETPKEILDRRLARGELGVDDYKRARAHLEDRPAP
jgi:putative membrane protein